MIVKSILQLTVWLEDLQLTDSNNHHYHLFSLLVMGLKTCLSTSFLCNLQCESLILLYSKAARADSLPIWGQLSSCNVRLWEREKEDKYKIKYNIYNIIYDGDEEVMVCGMMKKMFI